MLYVRLIHWKETEAEERADRLRALGYEVASGSVDRDALRALRENPPEPVVIDLSRLPSHARDVAIGIRSYKGTRNVPLVFVYGQPEKVEKVKALLPDALYTTWRDIGGELEGAIAHPPAEPEVPRSVMDAYLGTPLPKKLGIKSGSVVSLVNTPEGFEATLGELPKGATTREGSGGTFRCHTLVHHIEGAAGARCPRDGGAGRAGRRVDFLAQEVLRSR